MNKDDAYTKLQHALAVAKKPYFEVKLPDSIKLALDSIILGEHLTFRYVLITAILGKAVNSSNHTRSLQAQASLDGAYDARSLCHKVIVPFERNELDLRLGGSNEPFLNKPARFPSVEKTNSARKGRDTLLLGILYDVLEELNTSSQELVDHALAYSLSVILQREAKFSSGIDTSSISATQTNTLAILNEIMSVCSGGESAVIVVGALLRILNNGTAVVRISPVNQAGSSSREVGDIDLMQQGKVIYPVEIKDKQFSENDVLHAARVAQESNVNRLMFVIGNSVPRVAIPNIDLIISNLALNGFDISFAFAEEIPKVLVPLFDCEKRQMVIDEIPKIVDEIRASDATKQHIQSIYLKFIE